MRRKYTNKSTTPPPGNKASPQQHNRQASLSHNSKYLRDILSKFTPQEEEKTSPKQLEAPQEEQKEADLGDQQYHQQLSHQKSNQIEIEDIADDSDEERSIKHMNMFQIKSLEAGGGSKITFVKNYSEHDFLVKDQIKKNNNLMGSAQGCNKIQLIVRIRPFLISEQIKECLKVVNENGIRLFKDFHQIHFKFDNILMPKDPQEIVFARVQGIVHNFMMGLNGTVFAYGQTGAGKTYSIMGGESTASAANKGYDLLQSLKRGVLPRTLDCIFQMAATSQTCKFYVSFFEIYNEKIYDLLSGSASNQQQSQQKRSHSRGGSSQQLQTNIKSNHLEMREEKDGRFTIPELKRFEVKTVEEAYQYLDRGLLKRATTSTSLNNMSSRSHSIFQIFLEKEVPAENGFGSSIMVRSMLRIVDLAGSEKYTIKKDLPPLEKNQKVSELTSINSSLSALGQCISALSDPSRKHIPYRNSKLTKVLKDSLDETSSVALIICISPSIDSYKETLSTLQFADRAKKAILDGRNFSDSKLLQLPQNNPDSLNNLMKAYEEEKAIRKGLEQYMRENNQFQVIEELERLKKVNKELQEKVSILELNKNPFAAADNDPPKQKIKSCMKKSKTNFQEFAQMNTDYLQSNLSSGSDMININIVALPRVRSLQSLIFDDELSMKKRVRFKEKLDNDASLDSDMRERIEHNLKYNDDTIFDNISIFRDVNSSWIVHRKINQKDVHPSKMKQQLPIEDDDDEDEDGTTNKQDQQTQQNTEQLTQSQSKEQENIEQQEQKQQQQQQLVEMNVPSMINSLQDENLKQFWALPVQSSMQTKANTKPQTQGDVSPISKERQNNNSSQDLSKDLIDLENDQTLKKLQNRVVHDEEDDDADLSAIGTEGIAGGGKPKRLITQHTSNDPASKSDILFSSNAKQAKKEIDSFGIPNDQMEEIEEYNDKNDADTSEQFFAPDFGDNQLPQSQVEFGAGEQILSDSMMDHVNEGEPVIETNCSQDNQNTLILDSQSIIIEGDAGNHNRDTNLSQQMISFEASSIMQQRESIANPIVQNTGGQPQLFFSMGGAIGGPQSSGGSSNVNTDILTYSLTNTFTTIESLHDELTAIRNGLELSQKRGANIMRTIHKYAKEIEDNKISEFYASNINRIDIQNIDEEPAQQLPGQEELKQEVIDEENVIGDSSSILEKDILELEEENLNFIKDIKGFYSKIHNEISSLKSILMESAKNNQGSSPLSSRKHIISEKVPQKSSQFKLSSLLSPSGALDDRNEFSLATGSACAGDISLKTQYSLINLDCIDRSQEIINELRKEMEILLCGGGSSNHNQKRQSFSNKGGSSHQTNNKTHKSLKVLDLLEILQQSLAQAVTPTSNQRTYSPNVHVKGSADKKTSLLEQQLKQQMLMDQASPDFLLQDSGGSKKHRVHQHSLQINKQRSVNPFGDAKTALRFEGLPTLESPIKKIANKAHQEESKQRTPEIFKSLAKFDESSDNNNSLPYDRDMRHSQMQHPQNKMSQQQQDMQITLRSYSQLESQLHSNNELQNANATERRKGNVAADNTLTLIFDSDEEESNQIKEQVEEVDGEHSPIFNDEEDSKIEQGSSSINRTTQNLITSNSFQADNSLLFFANNIMAGGPGGGGNNAENQLESNFTSKFKHRNQSLQNKVKPESFTGTTPERERDLNVKIRYVEKKTNQKYLMPQLTKESPEQIQVLQPLKAQSQIQHNDNNWAQNEVVQDLNAGASSGLANPNFNKSTSKKSVQKYWNQYFNNNNKSMKQQQQPDSLLVSQLSQQELMTRNQQQYVSRSAYQSNSFKDDI